MSVLLNNLKQAKKPGNGKADLSVKGKEDVTLKDILNGTLFALSESFLVNHLENTTRVSCSLVTEIGEKILFETLINKDSAKLVLLTDIFKTK